MNRTDFQELAEIRCKDAEILLKAGQFEGAYYLCGYAVECALKACIAKNVKQYDFPPSDKIVREYYYTHDLVKLAKAAGLEAELIADAQANATFGDYWGIVKDWEEGARYDRFTQKDAEDMFEGVSNSSNGVLQWIKSRW